MVIGGHWWSFGGYSVVVRWSFCGHSVVDSVVVRWSFGGHSVVILWLFDGHSVVIRWLFDGHSEVIRWLFGGHSEVIRWSLVVIGGHSVVVRWSLVVIRLSFMVIGWLFGGCSVVIGWLFGCHWWTFGGHSWSLGGKGCIVQLNNSTSQQLTYIFEADSNCDLFFCIFSRSNNDHLPCTPFFCRLVTASANRFMAVAISGMELFAPGKIPVGRDWLEE